MSANTTSSENLGEYGKYLLLEKLTEGGMAELFLAKQFGAADFQRTIVIKRLHQHLAATPDLVRLFLDEAKLAAKLSHPNVVAITDLGEADGTYFIAMEYLAGEDLATMMRALKKRQGPPLDVKTALRIAGQAALGLHFAHEAVDDTGEPLKMVHRDVTASNIFVTYSGQVKVLDFGIAKAVTTTARTQVGVMRGTVQYMSPEQASAEPLDRRSDVYSLGVVLYEMLTLQRPFSRASDYETMKAVVTGQRAPFREVAPEAPERVVQIVERAMAVDPAERFQTAAEFAREAEAIVGALSSLEGAEQLARFAADIAGPERVQARTRMSAGALQRRLTMQPLPAVKPTVATPSAPSAPPKRRSPLVWLGALAAVLVAVGVGLFVARPAGSITPTVAPPPPTPTPTPTVTPSMPTPPAPAVAPPVEAPPPEPPASPMLAELPEVPIVGSATTPAGARVDAGTKVREVKRPVGPRRAEETRKVLADATPRLLTCFAKNKKLAPSPKGRVNLMLNVDGTGRVTKASVDLSESDLARCLRGVAKEVRFPPSTDRDTAVPLALNYEVR